MRTLMILRHAEAGLGNPRLSDRERPLNDRGSRTAAAIGSLIRVCGLVPDQIMCSPARRTVETAMAVVKEISFANEIEFDEQIYEAAVGALIAIVKEMSDSSSSALIVGHNPGMEGLIRALTGAIVPMPPAALAVIDLEIALWSDAGSVCGRLVDTFGPSDL